MDEQDSFLHQRHDLLSQTYRLSLSQGGQLTDDPGVFRNEHLADRMDIGTLHYVKPRSHIVWRYFRSLDLDLYPLVSSSPRTFPYPNTILTGLIPLGCWSGKVGRQGIASKLLQI